MYDYHLGSKGGVINTTYCPRSHPLLTIAFAPYLPDSRWVCSPRIQWLTFVRSHFLLISPSDSISTIHLRDPTTDNCSCHTHASTILPVSIACLVHSKEEGGQCLALDVINPQQPHSKESMAKEGKYRARADKFIY